MGIQNIHILIEEQAAVNHTHQVRAAQEQALVNAHRRGEHPYGRMRRDCPLCQLGK